jgi:hypothetical protein
VDILEHFFSKLMADIGEAVDRAIGASGRNNHIEGVSQCLPFKEFLREAIENVFALEEFIEGEFDMLDEPFVFNVDAIIGLQLVVFAVVCVFTCWTGQGGLQGEDFGWRVWRGAERLVLFLPVASFTGKLDTVTS